MNYLAFILWLGCMATDAGGQLAFKAAAMQGGERRGMENWKYMMARPWIWFGFGCYIAEFFLWMGFVSQVDLSVAIMLASLNIVIIMVAGRIFFGEALTRWRVSGIMLISAGVAIVGFGG